MTRKAESCLNRIKMAETHFKRIQAGTSVIVIQIGRVSAVNMAFSLSDAGLLSESVPGAEFFPTKMHPSVSATVFPL